MPQSGDLSQRHRSAFTDTCAEQTPVKLSVQLMPARHTGCSSFYRGLQPINSFVTLRERLVVTDLSSQILNAAVWDAS